MDEVFLCSKIAILEDEKRLVYGVVLVPDEVDSQGDIMPSDVVEEAAHDYLASSRALSKMHVEPATASVVESYTAPCDVRLGTEEVKKGSWVIAVKVADPELWEGIRSGTYSGFSVGGLAERVAEAQADGVGIPVTIGKAKPQEQGARDAGQAAPAGQTQAAKREMPNLQEDADGELHKEVEGDGSGDSGQAGGAEGEVPPVQEGKAGGRSGSV